MNALELFRAGHDYLSIAARCDASRRTEDESAKWQRTKTQNAVIRRRTA